MNRPYVKQYDSEGTLINPIEGYFPSKRANKEFPSGFPNRRERRDVLNKKNRSYSNKKGVQLVVTRIGRYLYTKYKRTFQYIGNKRIVHYKEA